MGVGPQSHHHRLPVFVTDGKCTLVGTHKPGYISREHQQKVWQIDNFHHRSENCHGSKDDKQGLSMNICENELHSCHMLQKHIGNHKGGYMLLFAMY